jgi:hypothetical protein
LQAQEKDLPFLEEVIKIGFHGAIVSIQIQHATAKWPPCLVCNFGLLSGHTPFSAGRLRECFAIEG